MNTVGVIVIIFVSIFLIFIFFFKKQQLIKITTRIYKKTIIIFNPETYISQLSIVILGIFLGLQADQIFHKKSNQKNIVKQFEVMDAEINHNYSALIDDKKKLEEVLNLLEPLLEKYKILVRKDYVLQREFQSLYEEIADFMVKKSFIKLNYLSYNSFDSLLNDDRFDLIDDIAYRTQLSQYLTIIKIHNNKLEKKIDEIDFSIPGIETITGEKREYVWEEVEGVYTTLTRFYDQITYIKYDTNQMIRMTIDFNKELTKYKNKIYEFQ